MKVLSSYEVEEVSGSAGLVNLGFNPQLVLNDRDSLGLGVAATGIANAIEDGYEFTLNAIGNAIHQGLDFMCKLF